MNKVVKFVLYFLLILIVLAGIAWFVFLNVPQASNIGKPAEFQLPATELFQAFEQDEATSNTKYIGKVIEVSGTIEEISTDEKGSPVVLLAGGGDFGGVLCTFEASEKDKVTALATGQNVKIKGSCSGMLMEVVLNRCSLVP
jgi:hypothetical protein